MIEMQKITMNIRNNNEGRERERESAEKTESCGETVRMESS